MIYILRGYEQWYKITKNKQTKLLSDQSKKDHQCPNTKLILRFIFKILFWTQKRVSPSIKITNKHIKKSGEKLTRQKSAHFI